MPRTVKNKIRLGSIFFFLLVVLSGSLSVYYLAKLKRGSQNVLRANYETIQYCHNMQMELDSLLARKRNFVDSFDVQLKKQEGNITEPGELEATTRLRQSFNRLASGDSSRANVGEITL